MATTRQNQQQPAAQQQRSPSAGGADRETGAQAQQQQQQQQVEAPVPAGTERTRTRRTYAPRTDIYETNDALVLVADMPGVSPDRLDVTLEKRELTIRGRTADDQPEGHSPIYREYEPGDYERTFVLSDEIDADKIGARLRDGVLHLTLPKAGPAEAKRIQVQAT
jgi:HSP20 family protein